MATETQGTILMMALLPWVSGIVMIHLFETYDKVKYELARRSL